MTAKLTGYIFAAPNFNIDEQMDKILCSGSHEEDIFGDSPSIDQIRKACLLAFYEFHQFPGQQAWMRIGKLTRTALWIGLDRLDDLHAHYPGWRTLTEHQREEWCLVWWCVYRLDSYANLSSGTPYLVDETLVNTAFVHDQQWQGHLVEPEHDPAKQRVFLPSRPGDLWEPVSAITSGSPQASLLNLHIITTTTLRQVGRAARLYTLRPLQGEKCLAEMERHLSAVRLSLPTHYLNPRRNAFTNETGRDHHARLITLFHLTMGRLLLSIMNCGGCEEGQEWILSWQQVLEACQDMASLSEQWNSSHNLEVDPAISFIIFTALIFLDIQKKSANPLVRDARSAIEYSEKVLLMQLEQFASIWTLPKLLTRESAFAPLAL